jgi:2-keto-4-pentenoate hydratase
MTAGEAASMTVSVQTAVQRLVDARSGRRVLAPLSETLGEFTLEHAYTIQDAPCARRWISAGSERSVGSWGPRAQRAKPS